MLYIFFLFHDYSGAVMRDSLIFFLDKIQYIYQKINYYLGSFKISPNKYFSF